MEGEDKRENIVIDGISWRGTYQIALAIVVIYLIIAVITLVVGGGLALIFGSSVKTTLT